MRTLTIGEVARESETGVETVRFYEREGLLEKPARRMAGYREFQPEAVARLRFIKQAQRLGFTLREVRDLLALKLDTSARRIQVRDRAVAKVADIDQRIKELNRMKKALAPLIAACDGNGVVAGCPILASLEKPCKDT